MNADTSGALQWVLSACGGNNMVSRRGCPSLRMLSLFGIQIRTKFEDLSLFGKQILGNSYIILRIHPNTDKRSHSNDTIMAVGSEDESKKYFFDHKMNKREVTMKHDRFVVFIRCDTTDIWGFRYGLRLGIGTLKIMASTGVFVLVVYALKHSNSGQGRYQGIILTKIMHKQSRSYQKINRSKKSPREATHKNNRTPPENNGRFYKIEFVDD
jgi:hypothetical protein